MITLPGYDAWKLSPPPEPTPDPDARLADEVETADYPPCPTCGKALPTVDREFYSPAEAIDMNINCTPCVEWIFDTIRLPKNPLEINPFNEE